MVTSMTVDQARASVRQLEKVCSIRPTVDSLVKLSTCYFILGDTTAAIPIAEVAFQKDPNNPIVLTNLAILWKDYGDHDGALKLLRIAYEELESEEPYVKLAYAESLLRKGLWEQAWPIYDVCRVSKENAALLAGIPNQVPVWKGTLLTKGRHRLAVVDEGGFGDSITFSRYLICLTLQDIDWIYFPFPELRGFYERASLCGHEHLAESGDKITASHWTTVQSLPANLGVTVNSMSPQINLVALPQFVKLFTLQKTKKPNVGLCWRAGEAQNPRRVHSMTEGQAMRLVCKTDHLVNWVNLNHNKKLPCPVENPGIDSWEKLAGLMSNLDSVVSVESGPMCLADALGKKLIVPLTANSDWRFLENGKSPFYPRATLIRNESNGGGIEDAITKTIEHVNHIYDEKKMIKIVG